MKLEIEWGRWDNAIGHQSFKKSKLNRAQSFACLWSLRKLAIFHYEENGNKILSLRYTFL